jgi:RNase P subunit RPR2
MGLLWKGGLVLEHKRPRPQFLSNKEYVCPRCGSLGIGNAVRDLVEACSYCASSASNYVEKHPDEYGLEVEKKEACKFKKTIDRHFCEKCHKPFQPTNNRQRVCQSCQKFLRNDRDRKAYREKDQKDENIVSVRR